MLVLNRVCGSVNRGGLRMFQKRGFLARLLEAQKTAEGFMIFSQAVVIGEEITAIFVPAKKISRRA